MDETSLSLEKLKINERLGSLEIQTARIVSHLESEKGTWERYSSNLQDNLKRLEEMIKRHDDLMIGNGVDKVGLMTKVDRIEQILKSWDWHLKALWTAIIGFVAKLVYDLVRK